MGFKSLELEATKEKILETISCDLIDRNQSVWRFARFCDAQEGRCSIALDAQWGGGKTFFVKQAKMLLESFNPFTNKLPHVLSEVAKERIRRAGTRIKEESPLTTQELDIGFRVFKLDESNMNDVYYSADEYNQGSISTITSFTIPAMNATLQPSWIPTLM